MAAHKINARDLITDLLLASEGKAISIKQMILAAKLFGMSENGIWVAVTRLANDRIWLSREEKQWCDYLLTLLKNSRGAILTNAALFGTLWAAGHPGLYLLWPVAYLTPFPLFIRIRSMAEHAGMQSSNSALTNTRTTKAGWLARAFVAPIHVNYHMEHHLMATVPYFKLPKMHQMLRERGYAPEPPTYLQVLDFLSQAPADARTKENHQRTKESKYLL